MRTSCVLLLAAALVCASAADLSLTNKLVEQIKQKNLDGFTAELSKEDMDPNQPDSSGRLPLVEAVRTRDLKFVDALLQYGAFAKSKDPATGASPLHVAFQTNVPDIAKMLLEYGADPNVEDKSGRKARDSAPSKDIRDLIAAYDKDGSMAFEEAPGTWNKEIKESSKEEYWFNSKTGEARWNQPPSCAWQRVDMQGHPIKYINAVTGQETHTIPPALSWVKVRQDGQEFYYNFHSKTSAERPPGELSAEMVKQLDANINQRWYNEKSKEYSWSDPAYHTTWRELQDESNNGRTYWFNVATGESVWEMPDELSWTKVQDDESGQHYFFNRASGDSTWDAPDHLAWVRHDSDL